MSHNPVKSGVKYSKRSAAYKPRVSDYTHREIVYDHPPVLFKKTKDAPKRVYKKKMALLLPAHNEESIIQATIQSAIAAGQRKTDIYVVDDASTDQTRKKALALLGRKQVLTVERSGKAKAVYQAIKFFEIEKRYQWLHVADSDSVFGTNYFRIYRRALNSKKYVAAVGFVQSLRGNWISKYRVFSYTYGQQVLRRLQSWMGMVSVFPGPVTSLRTDILHKLDFSAESLTEDFDITLQFHRLRLGKIKYIPAAINYTQDPQTFTDFCKQTSRWHRGFFQGVRKYKIGRRPQAIDIYIAYQLTETLIYLLQIFVVLPLVIANTHPHRWVAIPSVLLADYLVISMLALFTAISAKRLSILSVFPIFYFMRMVELFIFLKAFVEVIILKKFKTQIVGWQTEGRRYSLDSNALKDVAK
jgi:cellulose synthase/poly-beta-1,6-N-acetylglucosamine synthase-like glycosyltransferase